MRQARYSLTKENGEEVHLYRQIPAMLYHIFENETEAINWVEREKLSHGYDGNSINKTRVRPFIVGLEPYIAKPLTGEVELRESLLYMVWFLKFRRDLFEILYGKKITLGSLLDFGKELIKKDNKVSFFSSDNLYPHDRK